ncbi:MAG: IclR family transcriptional regulator [Clostridia bacterium]|nr:IclR family transcriptional regulator [Clostridia bacterium]MCL6521029.1 IclR family transcriptional regulator [Bacillota bacterium]
MPRSRTRRPGSSHRESPHVQVLDRALTLLETLAREENGLGLVEAANRAQLHPSTTYRLLSTLVSHGFVTHDDETGRYRIGLKAFEVGSSFRPPSELRKLAPGVLRALMSLTGETANLAILERGEATYIDQVESPSLLGMHARIGRRVPVHCTGAGKAILSHLSEEEVDAILAEHGLPAFTPNTITDRDRLMEELRRTRERGYALDNEEIELGVRCVAAPVLDQKGRPVAALSVTGPVTRFHDDRLPMLVNAIRAAAADLSSKLGYRPS